MPSLLCKAGDGENCLTKGQVESAKQMTSPLKDPKTGKTLFSGYLVPGSELGWATLGGPAPLAIIDIRIAEHRLRKSVVGLPHDGSRCGRRSRGEVGQRRDGNEQS